MSVRVGSTLISPLVNSGGGGSILTITITPQQGSYDSFTWSGATTQQIADAFAAGATIKLNYGSGQVYDVDQLRTFTSGANINVIATYLADYNTTIETQLFYDGTGEQFDTDFYTDSQVDNLLDGKQDTLTPGNNITIANDTISATDTTYTAGTNVQISNSNVISATDTTYTAGANVSISAQNVISATNTTYTAGDGIDITNNVISATGGAPAPITLTLTPDQQNELAFTWTGATIAQIETAFNAGTLILLSWNNVFLMVTNASFYTFQSRRRAVLSVYGPQGQAADYTLDSDGSGDVEMRQFSALTLSTTDIGEGATLAANTLYGVYE